MRIASIHTQFLVIELILKNVLIFNNINFSIIQKMSSKTSSIKICIKLKTTLKRMKNYQSTWISLTQFFY